jgi:triacylglycerol lipase
MNDDLSVQERIGAEATLALAQASLAAYTNYEHPSRPVEPPANFRCVAYWTGFDASILGGSEERFGLLFASVPPNGEGERILIFAFRGTDSDMDAYEDAFAETVTFYPYQGTIDPSPAVASGFYSIYNDQSPTMTMSMREQVFALLDRYRPDRVYITGHSLGAALSQLFTLDISVSRPTYWAANYNFASPMVGTASWKEAYEAQAAQRDSRRRTVRIFNYWDYAPSLPPSWFLGYTHVGRPFKTSFYVKDEWIVHLLPRHSLLNLTTVLRHAVYLNPQVWQGTFQDATDPGRQMISTGIPTANVDWAERLDELRQFENSVREGGLSASVTTHEL